MCRKWRSSEKRENNVEFYQTESPSHVTCFREYKLLAARELQNLQCEEDLFVDCVKNYEFEKYAVN